MKYIKHFEIIAEYFARARIDTSIADDTLTSIYCLELTLNDVYKYITEFIEIDCNNKKADFTEFRKDFLAYYGLLV